LQVTKVISVVAHPLLQGMYLHNNRIRNELHLCEPDDALGGAGDMEDGSDIDAEDTSDSDSDVEE
jgi:hypothetical protein